MAALWISQAISFELIQRFIEFLKIVNYELAKYCHKLFNAFSMPSVYGRAQNTELLSTHGDEYDRSKEVRWSWTSNLYMTFDFPDFSNAHRAKAAVVARFYRISNFSHKNLFSPPHLCGNNIAKTMPPIFVAVAANIFHAMTIKRPR